MLANLNAPYTYERFLADCNRLYRYSFLKTGSIGSSVLGKPIPFFRFGKGENKILSVGCHHGKEWITARLLMEILCAFCEHFAEGKRYGETDFERLFSDISFYVVPMLNPDGANLCIKGLTDDIPIFMQSRLIGMNCQSRNFIGKWQANIRGVDLNHNYDALFQKGLMLASQSGIYGPCASRYGGDHPESEPETKALADFTRSLSPHIVLSYHSQGEEIFYSFNGKTPKKTDIFCDALCYHTGYAPITASGLTDCSGYKDWVIDVLNIPAFTIEVGKGENPLPLSALPKMYAENFRALLALCKLL